MTVIEFNPLAPEMAIDPYPAYRQLRESSPIHEIGGLGIYVLSRYNDVAAFYRDRRLFMKYTDRETSRYGPQVVNEPFYRYFVQMAHVADAPMHTSLRKMFQAAFTGKRVSALRPRIKAVAEQLITKQLDAGGMEFISSFAEPFPRIVIGEMIGVPAEDNEAIGKWALELGPAFEFLPMSPETKAIVNDRVVLEAPISFWAKNASTTTIRMGKAALRKKRVMSREPPGRRGMASVAFGTGPLSIAGRASAPAVSLFQRRDERQVAVHHVVPQTDDERKLRVRGRRCLASLELFY